MFPKTNKEISQVNFKIGLKFLKKDLELVIDRTKCQGCGICSAVCPKEAIVSGPKTRLKDPNLHSVMDDAIILDVSDPKKCVYCGTCTVFCPFDAIKILTDGREVPIEELDVVKGKALPKLEGEMKVLHRTKKEAHVYMEGTVEQESTDNSVERQFKIEYVNNCPGECHKCVDICPNEALEIMPYEEALKTGKTIKINDDRCIACGSCVMACPSDMMKLKREKIHISGPYNKDFMGAIAERLDVPLPEKTEE